MYFCGTRHNFTLFTVFDYARSAGVDLTAVTVPLNPKEFKPVGQNESSITLQWKQVKDIHIPPKVDSVVVNERIETSITLEWENPNAAWDYLFAINDTGSSIIPMKSIKIVSYRVSNLKPGTLYAFSVITLFSGLNSTPYEDLTVTTIDCDSVNWHVTNSSIQGTVEGLFSEAKATNKSQSHVSPEGKTVTFTGLYPGATYEISLLYEMSSTPLEQCRRKQNVTILPPNLKADCEFLAGGYSTRLVWNKPDGVWTTVEVNMTGKKYSVEGTNKELIIPGLQPAKKYLVSLASLSGTVRSSEPYAFLCATDPRGVIGGSVFAVLLFALLLFVAVFILRKRPDIIRSIPVAKFPDHFYQLGLDENRGFTKEYEDLASVGKDQTHKVATQPENKGSNRYTNVLPYDWCRVKLMTSDPNETDYINASYMPGYNSNREYIATQGPLPSTVNHFWRMIWEQKVKGIVMVTNCTEGGRTKCDQYWPEYRKVYGELLITVQSEQQKPTWTLREFTVKDTNTSEEHIVKHFHFTAWPDHGVPQGTEDLIHFRGLLRQHMESERTKAPTVVHCSAGVGRTGTIIALDVLLQQLQKERVVGIKAFVHKMRLNRPYMVQTELQYIFLHQCIMDSLQSNASTEELIYENVGVNVDVIYENATALQQLQ
ncbi:receptor-type tyrosine-protein phosphatase H [Xenentodon cancila]